MIAIKTVFVKSIKEKYAEDIKALLKEADLEFVPPLSSRSGTTQTELLDAVGEAGSIEPYYKSISRQWAILAIANGKVLGFMSLIPNHNIPNISESLEKNVYLSTIIVSREYRKSGIAEKLYCALLSKFSNRRIFTRTWSTNFAHLNLLDKKDFYEILNEENGRGEGIDTVYYCHYPEKRSFIDVISQYHLFGSFAFFVMLVVFAVTFVILWLDSDSRILHELSIAFATSLIASALCLLSETLIKYIESKNDEYIFRLRSFGIENLLFHKDSVLKKIIPKCRKELWITGYRLIMTAKGSFRSAIEKACENTRGLHIRLLFVPMWSDTYKKVYSDDVSLCYVKVFYTLCRCIEEYGADVEIRITDKPIFNDTYKVDERIITGPYLHCADSRNRSLITAKDFFSLDITDSNKELYRLMDSDYVSVWEQSTERFDTGRLLSLLDSHDKFVEILNMPADERISLLQSCVCGLPEAVPERKAAAVK